MSFFLFSCGKIIWLWQYIWPLVWLSPQPSHRHLTIQMNETQHKTSQPQHQLSSSQYEKCLARSVKPDNEEMNLTKSLAQARRFMQLFFIRTIKSSCQEIQLRLLVLTGKISVTKLGVRLACNFKGNICQIQA